MDNLIVSEKFYSIQGEGKTTGIPAVFVRLAGCNILCKGKDWICDSIEVWQKGVKTPFNEVLEVLWVQKLRAGAHLVFTGGEPMLHQKKIIKYLKWFKIKFDFYPIVEIETNGTIIPSNEIGHYVDFWNVSPKLSNSGETKLRRYKKETLITYSNYKEVMFKFVISNETDLQEINTDFDFVSNRNIYLMPAGDSQEKLNKIRLKVINFCLVNNYRYSDRLHIVAWNQKTGV